MATLRTSLTGVRRTFGPALPPPTSIGSSNPISFTGILEEAGGAIVDAGIDWLRGKLSGAGGGATVPGSGPTVVPGSTLTTEATPCPQGSFRLPGTRQCVDLIPGGSVSGGGVMLSTGEAVMGRFGAALVPMQRAVTLSRCPRGAVLGADGLCYNKSSLRRSDRKWVPARKPLLTGGDLNAIARAARAAGKVKTQQKRLQKLGLLAKPKARQTRLPAHTHPHHHHEGA